jgi:hypothetical protein
MCHVGRFLTLSFLFFSKKKKIQNQDTKPIPAGPRYPFFISPHFLPKPIFPLPPSHGSPPPAPAWLVSFFSLVSVLKWRAKKTRIRRTQAPKTHLCATSAKRWEERVEWRFWMPATTPQPLSGTAGFALVSPPLLFSGSAVELLPHREFHYFVPCSTFSLVRHGFLMC